MTRNQILLLIVVGQGLLIALLFGLRLNNDPSSTSPASPASSALGLTSDDAADVNASTLAEALDIACAGLEHMREHLLDYRGRVVKRERIDGVLADENEMEIKVQCRRTENGTLVQPMRVYLKFLRPESFAGREAIWAEDQNEGRLIGHETGLLNLAQASLDPNGARAMEGNRYPITEIGLFNLVVQLIARGENDLQESQVRVTLVPDQMIGDRSCQKIRIELVQPHEKLDFQYAEIFIDTQRQIPLRYAAYGWPEGAEMVGPVPVQEEYTYYDIEMNVGLTDKDFDPANEAYHFPPLRIKL